MNVIINGEIVLYGTVGAKFLPDVEFFTDVDVATALATIGASDVRVRINSGGGYADNGVAIYNLLKSHAGKVHVVIDGVAASAASLIAMAGETITMKTGAVMMIHNAQQLSVGNVQDHEKAIEALKAIDSAMADIYAARTGRSRSEIVAEMTAETWMTGEEAVAKKYATHVEAEKSMRAAAFDYRVYAHAPERMVALAAMLAGDWTPPVKTPANATAKFWAFMKSHEKAVDALAASFEAQFKRGEATASNLAFSEIWNAAQNGEAVPADWTPSQRQFAMIDAAWATQAELIRREMTDMAATCALFGKSDRIAAFIAAGATQKAAYAHLQAELVAADSVSITSHFPSGTLERGASSDPAAIAASWEKAVEKVNKQYGYKP